MTIALRDYQLECLKSVLNESKAGVCRQLVSLPTGSGKTVIMAALAKQINKKTILLAHREELIMQARDKFALVWPEAKIGICMADQDEIHSQVVIASIQSACRPKRLARLKELGFELMMIDEAHHSVSDSYQLLIQELGFTTGLNLLVGVTATPMRSDKMGLGDVFEKITFSRSIGTMIKAGYLSPVVGRKILTNFSFEKIRTRNGDFDLADLTEAVNTEERNQFIVCKFKEYAEGRKGIAFCVDVQHCKDLANAFRKAGINAEAIYGEMSSEDRKNVLTGLKTGKIQIATSCGVLCEGFDEPSVDVIVMARPTKSAGLYTQCVGRGLRLWPGKQNCLVLDFTDRSNNLDSAMSLSETIPEATLIREEKPKEEHECLDMRPKIEALEEVDQEFDILGAARFIWVSIGEDEWSLLDDEKCEIVMSPDKGGYIARIYSPIGLSRPIVTDPLPLEYCSGVCEDFARSHLKIAFADMSAPWMNATVQPTQGQKDYLQKQGGFREGMNKAQAALEIRKIIAVKNKQRRLKGSEPITPAQKYFLDSNGIETTTMTKSQAQEVISLLKQKVG